MEVGKVVAKKFAGDFALQLAGPLVLVDLNMLDPVEWENRIANV